VVNNAPIAQLETQVATTTAQFTSMSSEQQYEAFFGTGPSQQMSVNQNNANDTVINTPGYTIDVNQSNGGTITATDKATGATTQVTGDPHLLENGKQVGTFTGNHELQLSDGTTIDLDTTPEQNGVSFLDHVTVNSGDGNSSVTVGNMHGSGALNVERDNAFGIGAFENEKDGALPVISTDGNGNVFTDNLSGAQTALTADNQGMNNAIFAGQDAQYAQANLMSAMLENQASAQTIASSPFNNADLSVVANQMFNGNPMQINQWFAQLDSATWV